MSDRIKYASDLGIDTGDIPAELHYFIVYAFACEHKKLPGNVNSRY